MEAATRATITSLERTSLVLSFDGNYSILVFAWKCTFSRAGHVYYIYVYMLLKYMHVAYATEGCAHSRRR